MKKPHFILAAKVLLLISAFAFVIYKTDIKEILQHLKSVNPAAVIAAYIFFILSQFFSTLRNQYYFKKAGISLPFKFTLGLYFTGMLYNNILPGGIGGDAYKVYLINKLTNCGKLSTLRLLLSDRASGLFILLLLTYILAGTSDIMQISQYSYLYLFLIIIVTVLGYFISVKIILKESPEIAMGAIKYSIPVQLFVFLMAGSVLYGLDSSLINNVGFFEYLIVFAIACILSIVPISIGGAGIREVTFMYGAKIFGLEAELGIAIALIVFTIMLLSSLNGLFFWHRLEKLYNEGEAQNGGNANT